MEKIKIVITKLGEQKLVKIIDNVGENEANEFIPKCGRSILVTKKTGTALLAKRYAKKCQALSAQDVKNMKKAKKEQIEASENEIKNKAKEIEAKDLELSIKIEEFEAKEQELNEKAEELEAKEQELNKKD